VFGRDPVGHGIGRHRRIRRAGGEDQAGRIGLRGGIHRHHDLLVAQQLGTGQGVAHQFARAHDDGGVADHPAAAVGQRHDQLEARLRGRVLDQREQVAGDGAAFGAGARQGFVDLGPRARIEAEGRLVAGHRLEVVDDVVARAPPGRHAHAAAHFADEAVRQHLPQLGLDRGAFAVFDHAVEVEGLDVGMALQEGRGEIVELGARHRRAEREQLVRDRHHFDRIVQALAHRGHALVGALAEGERKVVVF
jgi:hypothetical protein